MTSQQTFTWDKARFLAACCKAAEIGSEEEIGQAADLANVKLITVRDQLAYYGETPNFAVLAFRGTKTIGAWIGDCDCKLVQHPSFDGLVHEGFLNDLLEITPWLLNHKPDLPLWIAGHSLGGALAILASTFLKPTEVYTYGSPRVGTRAFAKTYDQTCYRMVNGPDIVPHLPPALSYMHVGELKPLGANNLIHDAMLAALTHNLAPIARAALCAHDIDAYIAAMQDLRDQS